jgi:hypothetical protein
MIPGNPTPLGKGSEDSDARWQIQRAGRKGIFRRENNGDRTFFVLLDGGKSTSTKIGTIGKSWKTLDDHTNKEGESKGSFTFAWPTRADMVINVTLRHHPGPIYIKFCVCWINFIHKIINPILIKLIDKKPTFLLY